MPVIKQPLPRVLPQIHQAVVFHDRKDIQPLLFLRNRPKIRRLLHQSHAGFRHHVVRHRLIPQDLKRHCIHQTAVLFDQFQQKISVLTAFHPADRRRDHDHAALTSRHSHFLPRIIISHFTLCFYHFNFFVEIRAARISLKKMHENPMCNTIFKT